MSGRLLEVGGTGRGPRAVSHPPLPEESQSELSEAHKGSPARSTAPRSGRIAAAGSKSQHQELFRKLLLRRNLLRLAPKQGIAYVPFCGDGDIAAELYEGRFTIAAADMDIFRVARAEKRLTGSVRVADCNRWPFADLTEPVDVADFDAYSHPYKSFLAFWNQAVLAERMVLFFTDGHRGGIARAGILISPDGSKRKLEDPRERKRTHSFYFRLVVLPWLKETLAEKHYRIRRQMFYLRGPSMLYFGIG